jgi:hypothetical protein
MGRPEIHTKCWFANLKGRDHVGDFRVDGRIILKLNLIKQDICIWSILKWLRMQPVVGFYDHENKPFDSIKSITFESSKAILSLSKRNLSHET